ncbi:MAG: phosphoglycolate phosphatase [Alphaproteobacteria bacterium]|nr:phosphoglycolate phosphatase [Alphaproteobacteria bacterium]
MTGAIVFDLDGTLIDSAPDIHAASEKVLIDEGLTPLSFKLIKSFIGNGVPTLVERMIHACDLEMEPDRHARMIETFLAHYDAAPTAHSTMFPGLAETLTRLEDEGFLLGVCTNKPKAPSDKILADFDLDRFFRVVVGGDSLAERKPDPAPLQHAFAHLDADRRLYVGDSEVDAETAKRAAIPFALFTEGYRKVPIRDLPHQYAFNDFSRFPEIAHRAFAGTTAA